MIGRVYIIKDILELNINYIGSTTQSLLERFQQYKNAYNLWIINNKKYKEATLNKYFKEHGIDNFIIKLLGEYEIKNNEELRKLEQYKIEENGNCINKIKAYTKIEKDNFIIMNNYKIIL